MTSTSGPVQPDVALLSDDIGKVSFSVDLFVAELRKALKELYRAGGADIFISWARSRFAYDIRLVRCIEYAV